MIDTEPLGLTQRDEKRLRAFLERETPLLGDRELANTFLAQLLGAVERLRHQRAAMHAATNATDREPSDVEFTRAARASRHRFLDVTEFADIDNGRANEEGIARTLSETTRRSHAGFAEEILRVRRTAVIRARDQPVPWILPYRTVLWRADVDKIDYEHSNPLHSELLPLLAQGVAVAELTGETWIFPAPND